LNEVAIHELVKSYGNDSYSKCLELRVASAFLAPSGVEKVSRAAREVCRLIWRDGKVVAVLLKSCARSRF